MNPAFRALLACALVLAVGACSVEPATTPRSVVSTSPSSSGPEPVATPSISAPRASATVADASFPPTRRLPIGTPAETTPETTIDAFLRLVRDPAFSYHLEGTGRWIVGDLEIHETLMADLVGAERHVFTSRGTYEVEIIVRDGSAVARVGTGTWQSVDLEISLSLYNLASAIVIADLGPDLEAGGYRLVIDAGFEHFPLEAATGSGLVSSMTEIVIDEMGRPLSLQYHRAMTSMIVGKPDAHEGLVTYTFERVGEALSIPDLPGSAGGSELSPTVPVVVPFAQIEVPGGGYLVEMPGAPVSEPREMTFGPSGIDARYLVAAVDEVRFELGESPISTEALAGMSAVDALIAARYATTSRLSNGDVLGWRPVTMAGSAGQEAVVDGADGTYRIRNLVLDDRLITLSVVGPGNTVGSAEADRFLSSLSIQ